MPRHHHQQILRRIYYKMVHKEVKLDPPLPSSNPTQGRWNGLHDKRPYHSAHSIDGQHKGVAGDIWSYVWEGKLKYEMIAPGKRAPRFIVGLQQFKPARRGDGTRRAVA